MKESRTTEKRAALASACILLFAVLLAPACTTIDAHAEKARDMPTGKALARYHCSMAEKFWRNGDDGMALRHLTDAVRAEPMMLEPRLGLVDFHIAKGFFDEAFVLICSTPEELKNGVEIKERLVYVLELMGDHDAAVAEVEKSSKEEGHRGSLFRSMAEARIFMNDFGGAMQFYRKVLDLDGEDEQALEALSRIYELNGQDAERGRVLLQLAAVCPNDPAYPPAAAEAMNEAGLAPEAVAGLDLLRCDDSGIVRGDVCLALALIHYLTESWEDTIVFYEEARGRGGCLLSLDDRMRLSEALLRVGEDRRAADELRELLDEEPGDPVVRAALALAYWRSGHEERARMVMRDTPEGQEKGYVLDAVKRRMRGGAEGD
jgi:Tfp pilus assembly protein PilF